MTLSVLTFSLISMEDPRNDTPVTLSGNKRKHNDYEEQPENLETVFQGLSDVLPLPKQKNFVSGNFLSTIGDDAYHSPDHYQTPNSSTEPEEAQVAALGLLASNALAQKPQKKVGQSSSRRLPKQLYQCDEPGCNNAFSSPYKLTRHKRTHTKERPHKCDWQGCNKAFSQKNNLERHKDTHTNKKSHICDWQGCNQTFTQKASLTNHALTHTGEKPHICDEPGCNQAFSQKGNLTRHKKKHTVLLEKAS